MNEPKRLSKERLYEISVKSGLTEWTHNVVVNEIFNHIICVEDELSDLRQLYYQVIEQRNSFQSQLTRIKAERDLYRGALERIEVLNRVNAYQAISAPRIAREALMAGSKIASGK